jgi:hypothetical protein
MGARLNSTTSHGLSYCPIGCAYKQMKAPHHQSSRPQFRKPRDLNGDPARHSRTIWPPRSSRIPSLDLVRKPVRAAHGHARGLGSVYVLRYRHPGGIHSCCPRCRQHRSGPPAPIATKCHPRLCEFLQQPAVNSHGSVGLVCSE